MQDPSRIPAVLDALRRTWEGQPDLSLPTLFARLANDGIGWGSTDEQLLTVLQEMERVQPGRLPLIDARVTATYLLVTESPDYRITVDPRRVITRRAARDSQLGLWTYSAIRPAFVGHPLVITDAEGIDHRLGVVTSCTLLADIPLSLDGLSRRRLGDASYLVVLSNGDTVVIDHRLRLFSSGRRELHREELTWESLMLDGSTLSARRPGGGAPVLIGDVAEVHILQAPPA
ncbi:hypothetical protein HCH15_11380 [Corynebacterium testudinoris]|uniref:Uncharacterized protein n=1 Tax=Corynebacterium testudinoris TaxID=136857 RepID=A0A0G3H9P7_9CORY|nr:hypothetical protein [Corynebacterium testudinoris]AKK07852.1 hypothetical protein CTEST_01985 [Corynebacterium testudinoris]MBX8996773.1 hypothetical protein [Corynebacterium testudinoris]